MHEPPSRRSLGAALRDLIDSSPHPDGSESATRADDVAPALLERPLSPNPLDQEVTDVFCSIIIPTYNTRPEHREALVASLDAQTLPADDFEVILADDGSDAGTVAALRAIAAERPNVTLLELENSGWACRPRNEGTKIARGDFVLFMDHDDLLYPGGLAAARDFAAQNDVDIINPRESRTNHWSWSWETFDDPRSREALAGTVMELLPMTPHKFFRRAFLDDHDVRFIEASRVLWEDVYFTVEAFAKGARVGVLHDEPVYHWVTHETNTSRGFGRERSEYWGNLDRLLSFFSRTLADDEDRDTIIAHWIRTRVLGPLGPKLAAAGQSRREIDIREARRFLEVYAAPAVEARLPEIDRMRVRILRDAAEPTRDLLTLGELERAVSIAPRADRVRWEEGSLRMSVRSLVRFHDDGLRISGTVDDAVMQLPAPILAGAEHDLRVERPDAWGAALVARGRTDRRTTAIDRNARFRAAMTPTGARGWDVDWTPEWSLPADVGGPGQPWDVAVRFWSPLRVSHHPLRVADASAPSWPAILDGREVVAYRNASGMLSVDVGGVLKSVVIESLGAEPDSSSATPGSSWSGAAGATLRIPLPGVHVHGSATIAQAARLRDTARRGYDIPVEAALTTDGSGAVLTVQLPGLDPVPYELQIFATGRWWSLGMVDPRLGAALTAWRRGLRRARAWGSRIVARRPRPAILRRTRAARRQRAAVSAARRSRSRAAATKASAYPSAEKSPR